MPRSFKQPILYPLLALALLIGTMLSGLAYPTPASAESESTYSSTKIIPVPPVQQYAGSGGGDGWNVALESGLVYNVFHHASQFTVACHSQLDASECWAPKTIVDDAGVHFATGSHSGVWVDTTDLPRLYGFATRVSDGSNGVVCVDLVAIGQTGGEGFCGFEELQSGSGPTYASTVSAPVKIGSRHYAVAFNATGSPGNVLCIDDNTRQGCAGQPYELLPASEMGWLNTWPVPSVTSIGDRLFVPLSLASGEQLTCWDPAIASACAGSWPVDIPSGVVSSTGSAIPILTSSGTTDGVCVTNGSWSCFTLGGVGREVPAGMASALTANSGWNAGYLIFGTRLLVPNGNSNLVECYDAVTASSCVGFPLVAEGAYLVYALAADPLRGGCVWLNSDTGPGQIQNFDAFTGGACGEGATRVLASQFIVDSSTCRPSRYHSLSILRPEPGTYARGTVEFLDSSGNPVALTPAVLDGTGTVDLTDAVALTAGALPQFLITLEESQPSEVHVQLTWSSAADDTCLDLGAEVIGGEEVDGCPDVYFVALQGSGEYYTSERGLENSPTLRTVHEGLQSMLPGQDVGVRVVNYPARSVDVLLKQRNVNRYLAGSQRGVAQLPPLLSHLADACPNVPITIAGYSQGAMVIHDVLEDLAARDRLGIGPSITGVALIADPKRASQSQVSNFGTAGYFGDGLHVNTNDIPALFLERSIQVCDEADVVCDTVATRWSEGIEIHSRYAGKDSTRSAGAYLGVLARES